MIHVELNEAEWRLIAEVLEADLSDLRMEIAATDRLDYRDHLKTRKAVLIKVLEDLQEKVPAL